MTSTNTTIHTPWERRISVQHTSDPDRSLLTIEALESGDTVRAALTTDHAHKLAAALTGGSWSLPDLMWLRTDLANQPPAGQWTRDDLPCVADLVKASVDAMATELGGGADAALDAVVDHLNTHHPMLEQTMVPARPVSPEERGELWARIRDELRGVYPSTTDQDHRKLDLAASASADTAVEYLNDRGGLGIDAREPLERALRERDAAVARAEAHAKGATRANLDRDKAYEELTAMTIRAEAAERDRDYARARLREVCSIAAVSRDEVKQAMQGQWGGSFDAILDAVWSLVAGSDPAVHVVRESDLPTVSRGEDEHWRDEGGKYVVWGTHTLESAKANVKIQLRHAAEFEAVARAIEAEAAVDPVEDKARELAKAGGIDFDEQEPDGVEMLLSMARHVLGQEADQ